MMAVATAKMPTSCGLRSRAIMIVPINETMNETTCPETDQASALRNDISMLLPEFPKCIWIWADLTEALCQEPATGSNSPSMPAMRHAPGVIIYLTAAD